MAKRGFGRSVLGAALALIGLPVATDAAATENGRNPFPLGLNGTQVGNLPPPGVYLVNEFIYIRQDRFNDSSGNKLFPDFKLDVVAYAPRLLWNTGLKLGGADVAIQAIQPIARVRVGNAPPAPFVPPNPPFGSETESGLADLIVTPLFAWHQGEWNWIVGADINFPTGHFDANSLNNLGLGYWAISPAVAVTYLSKDGLEVSGKLTVDFNFENRNSNYNSGEAIFFEPAVNYYIPTEIGRFAPGVGGFLYKQLTDDEVNGVQFRDGFRGQTIGIGPQLVYQHPKGPMAELKYQREFAVENRPEGDRFFARVFVRF